MAHSCFGSEAAVDNREIHFMRRLTMRNQRSAWNKGRLRGQKPELRPKEIWSQFAFAFSLRARLVSWHSSISQSTASCAAAPDLPPRDRMRL